jgi:hypothetical protein
MSNGTSPQSAKMSLFRQAALDHRHIQLEGELSLRAPRYLGAYLIALALICILATIGFCAVPVTVHYHADDIIVAPSRTDERVLAFASPVADRAWKGRPRTAVLTCGGQAFRLISSSKAIRPPTSNGLPTGYNSTCEIDLAVTYPNLKSMLW